MTTRFLKQTIAAFVLGLLVMGLTGCGEKEPETPAPLTPANFASELTAGFETAPEEAKNLVTDAIKLFDSKNFPQSLLLLERLFAREDLEPEQRTLASRAVICLNVEIQNAAAAGNSSADAFRNRRMEEK